MKFFVYFEFFTGLQFKLLPFFSRIKTVSSINLMAWLGFQSSMHQWVSACWVASIISIAASLSKAGWDRRAGLKLRKTAHIINKTSSSPFPPLLPTTNDQPVLLFPFPNQGTGVLERHKKCSCWFYIAILKNSGTKVLYQKIPKKYCKKMSDFLILVLLSPFLSSPFPLPFSSRPNFSPPSKKRGLLVFSPRYLSLVSSPSFLIARKSIKIWQLFLSLFPIYKRQ